MRSSLSLILFLAFLLVACRADSPGTSSVPASPTVLSSLPTLPPATPPPDQTALPTMTQAGLALVPTRAPTQTASPPSLYLPLVERALPPSPTAVPPTPLPTATVPDSAQSAPLEPPRASATPFATHTPLPPQAMQLRGDLPAINLRDWPRPAGDNGRCMHFLKNQYFSEAELTLNIQRMQQLGARWALVVYADENQIKMAAPRFAEAGIIPVWRKMLRAHQRYYDWERDIKLVQSYGLPPYFQLYNEPSLREEWMDGWEGGGPDERLFLDNLMQASRDVYNAGGYVGWQFVNPGWLDAAIDEVERRQGTRLFERFFFIPHSYGENLPPAWNQDGRGALSYRYFADQLERRLGFRPMLFIGEGGWRINSEVSPDYPRINDALHRQYHVELYEWFRQGTVSDGEPLPDELFAYCVWLIAAKGDDNAWWDSFAGNRQATIDAISALPPFERRFSWQR